MASCDNNHCDEWNCNRPKHLNRITNEHRAHAEFINDQESKEYIKKYLQGAIEHGGGLWQVSADKLVDYAIEEVLDLKSYLYTLKTKIQDMQAELEELRGNK